MKKTFYILALAAIALSCTKEMETSNPAVSGEKVTVKVALAEDDATKVAFTEAADKKSMSLAWESTDKISINGSEFTIKSGFTAHEAEFEGTAPSSSPYTIIYPGKYADAAAFNARSYAGQEQTGNSSTAHLEYNAMLSGVSEYEAPKFDSDWATDKGGSLVQNAVVQMRLQLPDGASNPTSVSLIATNDIFPTTNAGTDLTNEMTLSLKNVTLPTNRILEAYMMVSAAGVTISAGEVLTVAVVTPDATYVRDITLSAQTWNGGGQYTLQLKNFNVHNFDINTVADLEMFRDGVNSGDILWQTVHANLTADLDCSGITSWTPIGNGTFNNSDYSVAGNAFRGVFDGGNHVLENFKMNGTPAANTPYGFFGILDGATVKNLTFGASSGDAGFFKVTPSGIMEAGIVAGVALGATIQNVTNFSPMSILENTSTGAAYFGMVGYVMGTAAGRSLLDNVYNHGEVNAHGGNNTANGATGFNVAGIAGFGNSNASTVINLIKDCDNYGSITANTGRVAGILAACNTRTEMDNCNNRGNIINDFSNSRIAGICVILGSGGKMTGCSNYGDVIAKQSNSQLGGLACLLNNANVEVSGGGNHGLIVCNQDTYRGTLIGNINTFASVDGLVAGGAVANYNGGDYTYPAVLTSANYMSYIGKIKSGNESKVTNITFEAWDGYPAGKVILISNASELLEFATKVNSGEFVAADVAKLTADIDCSSITSWTPIGNVSMSAWTHVNLTTSGNDFMGTFDGQGHTISNLAMSFSSSGSYKAYGFFGSIGNEATVKNIVFDSSCSMSISASYGGAFGMLAGLVKGATIENIENHGAITGGGTSSLANGASGRCAVGAIIGEVHPSASPASLTGLHNFGNIGTSESSIFTAYNNVQTGANAVQVGGIAGFSTNTNNSTTVSFTNCINDGDIYTNAGRTSGLIAACNRYTKLKDCTNNGDQYNSFNGNCRLGNITCITAVGSSFEDVCNKGDLIAPDAASAAGLICLINDDSVTLTRCSNIGATIVCKGFDIENNKTTYAGALYGQCNKMATFTQCSVSGKVGNSKTDLLTLTATNYFPFVGQAYTTNTSINTTNITFAE